MAYHRRHCSEMTMFELNVIKIFLCCSIVVNSVLGIIKPVIPLTFDQIAENAGLPCEKHEVTTEDGYILEMFRIPGDKNPVMLLSGAFGTADDYILRENTSLPFVLAKAGHDVWVGNVRGCRYGRRHVKLDPDTDDAFWNFTFHEYAVYDTPAMIDFVLNTTEQKQLSAIAWSLGTTSFYILGSERPEYIDKVKVVISFAPICYLHHSPAFATVQPGGSILDALGVVKGQNEVFGENSTTIALFRNVCSTPTTAYFLCLPLSFLVYGFNFAEIEREYSPVIFQHYPSSMSGKTLSHLLQVVRRKELETYDYGRTENMRIYGSPEPRKYDLSKNTMRIELISGKNDLTSTLKDVELLKQRLPNYEQIILEPRLFNHLDFVQGKSSHEVLYKPIVLDLLNKYN